MSAIANGSALIISDRYVCPECLKALPAAEHDGGAKATVHILHP